MSQNTWFVCVCVFTTYVSICRGQKSVRYLGGTVTGIYDLLNMVLVEKLWSGSALSPFNC